MDRVSETQLHFFEQNVILYIDKQQNNSCVKSREKWYFQINAVDSHCIFTIYEIYIQENTHKDQGDFDITFNLEVFLRILCSQKNSENKTKGRE